MAYRTKNWDEVLAKELRDKEFSRQFFWGLIQDGVEPADVIRRVVRAYGVKELSEKVKLRPESVARVLKDPDKARESTLNILMKPFGVRLSKQLVAH